MQVKPTRRTAKTRTDREVAKRIALDLPDVELASHHGTMDMRVYNKIFATFPAQEKLVVLKCTAEKMALLTKESPETFAKARGEAWMQVALEEIDRETLHRLLIDAWLLAAPAQLRRLHEAKLAGPL